MLTGNYIMPRGHKVQKTQRTLSISLRLAKIWANLISFALLRAKCTPYLGVHKREFTNPSLSPYRPCHRPQGLFFKQFKSLWHYLCLSLLISSGGDFTWMKRILNQKLKCTWKGPYPAVLHHACGSEGHWCHPVDSPNPKVRTDSQVITGAPSPLKIHLFWVDNFVFL